MEYTDLKLIDELLCDIRQQQRLTWEQMETYSSVTRDAMNRVRAAWWSGEMKNITLGLANYLRATKR